jgi:glutamate:Na+ symporter, ESS family
VLSFGCLCLLLGVGYYLRRKVRLFQKLHLPASVIAGLLGLILIQISSSMNIPNSPSCYLGWSKLPGLLINVVFACLFLGVTLPKVSKVWGSVSRQLAYGQLVAWGQYVIGCAVVLLLLKPIFNVPDLFAGIMPVGFEGGHGTAAGMGIVFEELGWGAGKDFALTSATCGIVGAIIVGMALINWAIRCGYVVENKKTAAARSGNQSGVIPEGMRCEAGKLTVSSDVLEPLSLHFVFVGAAILIGLIMQQGLLFASGFLPSEKWLQVFRSFPLFPLCMLGGILIQICLDRFDRQKHVDHGMILRIQNTALDFLVVAAIATIRLKVIAAMWVPLVILVLAGVLWNVFCLVVLARRVFTNAWFERAIAEMGQSMGVTATGLLLLRVVDPDYETPAAEAFACKQLFHEPFMGGGLWTSMAIPLLALWGGWVIFFIALGAMFIWSIIILLLNRQNKSI